MIVLTLRIGDDPILRDFAHEAITIGRSSASHVVLNEQRVSRLHARIEKVGAEIRVLDLKSGNGTLVNGRKVDSHSLMVGDTILIGPTALTIMRLRSTDPPEFFESEHSVLKGSPAGSGDCLERVPTP